MKYKLLAVKSDDAINIGDYVQALASAQFLPQVDGFIEREALKDYHGDSCKMIMNGWFIHDTQQWPPSDKINPLFVAFHINSQAKEEMLKEESINYLKQHEPIGCRDTATVEMLKEKGVEAYFSGCMTLTLGYKYRDEEKDGSIYFVDPYFDYKKDPISIISNLIYALFHLKNVLKIYKTFPHRKSGLVKLAKVSAFYKIYRKMFADDVLTKAKYICQQSMDYNEKFNTNESLLLEAERLVRKYAKARLVVTSRIHCALPCLGIGTPVLFTDNANQSIESSCRMGGLIELFNVIKVNNNTLTPSFPFDRVIDEKFNIKNSNRWKKYQENLVVTCKRFLSI